MTDIVQSGLVPLLDEETGRFPDEFAPPSVAADATAARDAAEAAGRAQEAAEAAENNAAGHEREAGQIVEDATAAIPGLISEQVTAQIDPKVAAATQAKTDAETARGIAVASEAVAQAAAEAAAADAARAEQAAQEATASAAAALSSQQTATTAAGTATTKAGEAATSAAAALVSEQAAAATLAGAVTKAGTAGFIARTGAGVTNSRTLTAGAGINIANGDGASGNPTISASYGPIAAVTYSGNREIAVTAVDDATDTLTSAGHGLANGDLVAFRLKQTDTGSVNPVTLFPGGLTQAGYYVVGATTDTFQLSLTSGGAAVGISASGTTDLARIVMEKAAVTSFTVAGLPAARRYRVLATLFCPTTTTSIQLRPTTFSWSPSWYVSSSPTAPTYPSAASAPVAMLSVEAIFDSRGSHAKARYYGLAAAHASTTDLGCVLVDRAMWRLPATAPADIVDVTISCTGTTFFVMNGTTIEVFPA